MAEVTRSAVYAIKEESVEGVLEAESGLVGADFTVLREGFSFESGNEVIDSDELVNDIGSSKSFLSKETPSASIPKYWKHSGSEGVAPDYGLMIESAMGSEAIRATERDVVSSTAGSATAAATITVDVGEGAEFSHGDQLLIKDGTNGYQVRGVESVSGDVLTLNYNLSGAAAAAVNLGKNVRYAPATSGHPTYSAFLFQESASTSAYLQAMAGCRTTSMEITGTANEFAEMNFDFEGIKFFFNPVTLTSSDNVIDFDVTGPLNFSALLEEKSYNSPFELAAEAQAKMNGAQTTDTITVTYNNDGTFTFSSDGATFDLNWTAGSSANAAFGFDAVDETGSLTYSSDSAIEYGSAVTPAFDSQDPLVVRNNELLIGDFDRNVCRQASSFSLSVETSKTDVNDICAESGVSESITLSREVTFSATLLLKTHEVDLFNSFISNSTTQLQFTIGEKDGAGNWTPGTVCSVYMGNMSIVGHVVADEEGFQVLNLEGKGFVDTSKKDLNINFL